MTSQIPRGEHVPTADQRVLMHVDWAGYEALLAIRGERPQPRMAYLDGVLELMTTSVDHERIKGRIACVVEAYMLEVGIEFDTRGGYTMKRGPGPKAAGIESDVCYKLGADFVTAPWPDLALEVVWTHGGIDKLEAYRRIGVSEVWFWEDDAIAVHVLRGDRYVPQERSEHLPELDLALVCQVIALPTVNAAVRALREALRARSP